MKKVNGKQVYLDYQGNTKQFNIIQGVSDPAENGDQEIESLIETFDPVRTSPPPGIMITEILSRSDPIANSENAHRNPGGD